MYLEIKTDSEEEIVKAVSEIVNKGQRAMLTLGKDGDYYSLSINDSVEVSPEP
ncbi:MAG: hypothetical protein QOE77_1169 [Blastocatellia bacterium]|nr:hypothetical protein [Blastocatellia bacterium]